jgi:osmotically-inducible protein OsmY
MPTRFLLAALLIVLTAPSLLGAEQADADLARSAADVLRRCPHYTIFDHVAINVVDGAVTLSGDVTSAAKRTAVAGELERLAGVKRVINSIEVLPASPADADLRQRAARAIYSHPAFWHYAAMPSPPVHIVVRNGQIRLAGTVASDVERALAQSAVAATGATGVRNDLVVR